MAKRSDPTAAARAKRYRDNRRLLASGDAAPAAPPTDHPAPVTLPPELPAPAAPAASSPLHETAPVAVSSADGFAVVPLFEEASGKQEPFAPPPPEPPKEEKPPLTEQDVAGIALGVLGYWKWGLAALLAKNPDLVELARQLPAEMQGAMPKVDGFIYASTVRVCQKYRLRIPYQDELVVATAIGIATFGIFGPPIDQVRAAAASAAPAQPTPATEEAQ